MGVGNRARSGGSGVIIVSRNGGAPQVILCLRSIFLSQNKPAKRMNRSRIDFDFTLGMLQAMHINCNNDLDRSLFKRYRLVFVAVAFIN